MKVSIVTCAAWVPQGKAKANPDKVEVSAEELKRIIEETAEKLENAGSDNESEHCEPGDEVATASGIQQSQDLPKKEEEMDVDDDKENKKDKGDDDIDKIYDFGGYDEETENQLEQLTMLSRLTMYADPADDPLLTSNPAAREEDEASEAENHIIQPDDNLIAVGHVEDDAAILEVYVYNESGDALYVHHDNLLPTVPLCMEWLNYNPGDDNLKPGNLVAVGTMSPVIEVWDLDLIDGLEPAFKLGFALEKKSKKKKNKEAGKKSKKAEKAYGHTDAVLAVAWNKEYEHVLASGSADSSIILWDLQSLEVSQTVQCCSGRVQCLQWHPQQGSTLLAGSSAGGVHVIDCTDGSAKSWQLQGEIERVLWARHTLSNGKEEHCILASSDTGALYCINVDNPKPLWSFKPHQQSCTGLQLSSGCPGLLVTGSEDGAMRVWDTNSSSEVGAVCSLVTGPPRLVEELQPQVGRIHCLSAAIEQPFVFCIGGDQGDNCFKVWDIRASKNVRRVFCPRLGLPVDEEEPDKVTLPEQSEKREDVNTRFFSSPNRQGSQQRRQTGAQHSGHVQKRNRNNKR